MLSAAHTWSLTAIAIAAGMAMLWAFGRFSDQAAITLAKRKVRAQLYAFRLFAAEPAVIFRTQGQLLLWNARYLALVLRPTAVILIPMVVLLMELEAVYGRRALNLGETAIVTAQMTGVPAVSLEGRGVAVESPPVRIPAAHQVAWRVRAMAGASGVILRGPGVMVEKTVETGRGLRYLSIRRSAAWLDWLREPAEPRLPSGGVRWIEVSYPPADIDVLGWGVNWLVWFFIVSLLAMLAFRRFLGVTF